jgi:hypothetical protein
LHLATFEAMDLGRRFRSIYLAGATFNLLPDDESAAAALERVAAHLERDGAALVPLFVPQTTDVAVVGSIREHVLPGGAVMRLTVLDTGRDEAARIQTTTLRYELIDGDQRTSADRNWTLHWIDQPAFAEMAERAGLRVRGVYAASGTPATPHDTAFTFVLQPRRS